MEQPHQIRLQGPWQCVRPSENVPPSSAEDASHVTIHYRELDGLRNWLGDCYQGPILFRRRFQRPSGLTPQSQVRLIIASEIQPEHSRLNQTELNLAANVDFDILGQLQITNELELCFRLSSQKSCPGLLDLFTATLRLQ
ncbi:MAG: hypothetical protein P8N76_26835 [Pirellulaceae bacterium]|nr:hypothetical protein [Pirellulaceae bacterium]